ncbi:MAG: tRNA dihydrouridine synthase DusB [Candidatus Omnitrophica bacterium]|nr:tRNA dihydrouridine synthase DusB [Candidatus Omnitrophota bacterium]
MDPKVYLAPMSGITDLPLRLMSRKFGAEQCFFEMLHSNSIIYGHPKNGRIIKTLKKDRPIAAQLLGADTGAMFEAAQKLLTLVDISFLDINSACPAKKVVKKGEGAALLQNRARLGRIIKKLSSNLDLPVTVKLRTGYSMRDVAECVKTAKLCEDKGASTVFLHGRTRSQGYSGDIDYESIRAVKKALKIPVFGSGNIFNPVMAEKMFVETGCDGILVARGALGNPWIFKDIRQYLKTGRLPRARNLSVKIKALKEHLDYINKYNDIKGSRKTGIMGRVAMWYLKGFPNASKVRGMIFRQRSYNELINLINSVTTSKEFAATR